MQNYIIKCYKESYKVDVAVRERSAYPPFAVVPQAAAEPQEVSVWLRNVRLSNSRLELQG